MGEGWSDWWALMFLQRSSDATLGSYPLGNWALNQSPSDPGIRRFPYSFNMSANPLTIDAFGTSGFGGGVTRSTQSHDTGEIWCSALWDMNWLLINKHGFEPNIQNGYNPAPVRGNTLALKLVMDALKLQPSNPSFEQARDAILAADVALTGGANQLEIWTAFARRGMGEGFDTFSSSSTSVTPSFVIPVLDPIVTAVSPNANIPTPVTNVTFTFNQAMNTTSFDIAADVVSFTGPGGTNLKPNISGFQWLNNTQLRINFPQLALGSYTMTIGPNILAADNGNPMNQNGNTVIGESADAFTVNFTYGATLGPEGFGYRAAQYPVEGIDLVIGGPGVTTITTLSDNDSASINLGGHSFNFYGQSYTGTQISLNPNGLITFNGSSTASANTDLTTSPSQRSLAVLWDNWTAGTNVPGATDSAVLYKLEDITGDLTPDRLVIEWSDLSTGTITDGVVTFQAVLQLNTGATPGRIYFNYADIALNNASRTLGASATVGLKDTNNQGPNRLLISQDSSTHPWVQSNRAIVIGTDVDPPEVLSASFEFLTSQQLVVQFSEDVSQGLASADVIFTNTTLNQIINPTDITLLWDAPTKTARFRASTLLPDGNYTAQVLGTGISDLAGNPLDGDADLVAGGNYNTAFFVKAGDADRNRTVDVADLGILATNWQQSPRNFGEGDFDYNGTVDVNDLGILATAWQSTLAMPLAPVSSSSPFSRTPAKNKSTLELVSLL
jgi:hypothetical protein